MMKKMKGNIIQMMEMTMMNQKKVKKIMKIFNNLKIIYKYLRIKNNKLKKNMKK